MRASINCLWKPHLSLPQWIPWVALAPLSGLYGVALRVRAQWWRWMAQSAPVAIVSVGNLTVGGNAKTPFTLFLANLLSAHGLQVGIVSRGYGRKSKSTLLVSDHGEIRATPAQAGDEPLMLAHFFNGPIAVARRRIEGIRLLLARGPLEIIVLDDGFQHLRLRRDLDLVMVRSISALSNDWVLPAGPLREPCSALQRADALVVVADSCDNDGGIVEAMGTMPLLRIALNTHGLTKSINGAWRHAPLSLDHCRVLAVSGIADPAKFIAMLNRLGANVVKSLEFPDHHRYSDRDWEKIRTAADGVELVITTEKDLVKLERLCPALDSLYALHLEVAMPESDSAQLLALASDCVSGRAAARTTGSTPAGYQGSVGQWR